MTLGERIRILRMKHAMSQEELAAKLEVSRQSVSKWETDAATPDLDKLIKLSVLFHLTLDELIRGEPAASELLVSTPQPKLVRWSARQGVGVVLLILAAFSFWGGTIWSRDWIIGMILAFPFLICGAICLVVRWHPGLICAWTVSLVLDVFVVDVLRFNWRTVLRMLCRLGAAWLDEGWKWFDLAMMVLQIAWIVTLMVWLYRCLRPLCPGTGRQRWILPVGGWVLFVLLHLPWISFVIGSRFRFLHLVLICLSDWFRFALLTILLACVGTARRKKEDLRT